MNDLCPYCLQVEANLYCLSQVLSVAAINGFELEIPQPWSYLNKPAGFTDKFPYGKIPAFEGTDGFKVTEGATIARYRGCLLDIQIPWTNLF